jgi:hypothetical protein
MAVSRTVFYGFGAYIGAIKSATACDWWPDDPATLKFASSALIPTDLACNVTAVRNGKIGLGALQVDDHRIDGGMTTIGPLFPGGVTIGAVWLAETYYNTLGNRPPRQPPSYPIEAYDYELTSILYWDGPLAGRRYHGFYAKIVSMNGTLSLVEIWNPGTGKAGGNPAGSWWLDLAAGAHPIDPIATQISKVGQDGALFLDEQTTAGLKLTGPKRPAGQGNDYLPGTTSSVEDKSPILGQPRLSVISRHADAELARIHHVIGEKALVDGRGELEELLGRLLAARNLSPITTVVSTTLDLIGHSTPGSSLLQLGDWVIDTTSPTVTAFFRELADNDVTTRLGIHAVRLLGCNTAGTEHGRSTICTLSDILGVPVYGSTNLLFSAHYDEHGFKDEWRFLLASSDDLRREDGVAALTVSGEPDARILDIDGLPLVPHAEHESSWPRHVVTTEAARAILDLVCRTEGALMPGLLAMPSCELALPSTVEGQCHVVQVILEGKFIRVHPDGATQPGIVYPVTDPRALRVLIESSSPPGLARLTQTKP